MREMKIQIVRKPLPIRMDKIWNTDHTECWCGCGATAPLIRCWWNVTLYNHFGGWCGSFFKSNILLGMVACNPSTQESEAGGFQVLGQPEIQSEILSQNQGPEM
jgi:hypothetical protein